MREMRRKERETSPEEALALFRNCEYMVMSMVDPDGKPYAVPLSPAMDGDVVYFHCALSGTKLDCIKKQPRVCLVCADGVQAIPEHFTTAYQSAILYGEASVVDDDTEKIHALRLICEKYALPNMAGFDDAVKKSLSRTGIVKIKIDGVSGKQKKFPKNS